MKTFIARYKGVDFYSDGNELIGERGAFGVVESFSNQSGRKAYADHRDNLVADLVIYEEKGI